MKTKCREIRFCDLGEGYGTIPFKLPTHMVFEKYWI